MEEQEYYIKIATVFTKAPGGRYKNDGDKSGEEFRDAFLLPLVLKAMKNNKKVTVDLDGVIGYGSSFLEEAFGGLERILAKQGKSAKNYLELVSSRRPYLISRIESYMDTAVPQN